ncbi:hypothetical protein BGZ97_004987 [Linnemannia gamsii]|uniref:Uncharacterized protein n=1 Tax=Linnemannia gamsii TaxID=64522 RepID=A0A9P6UGN3_9FUNG|nr:hypothetical protein BGZ97_004987 [Linnemannia gamsii]
MARVRALQYQAHSPSDDDGFYLTLVNEVIDFAQEDKVNDVSFETEIERILARYPPPTINTTQDDEEQEAEEQGGGQGAEYQDDAQSSDEEGAVPDTLQDVLKEMREISARQARYASRMIVLIAAMEHLSVA